MSGTERPAHPTDPADPAHPADAASEVDPVEPARDTPAPAYQTAAPATDGTELAPARTPTPWARRLGLAGAAAALLAVGGVGGYALSEATDEGDRFGPASTWGDRDGDGSPHERGFGHHDGPGRPGR